MLDRAARFVKMLTLFRHHPITVLHPWAALWRWTKWQVSSRLAPGPIAFPFADKATLISSPGMSSANGNHYVGLLEFEEMGLLLHYLKPGDLFVDAGANIGSYTILSAVLRNAHCIAIEPIQKTFDALSRNVRVNDVSDRVQLFRIGLSDEPGELPFTESLDSCNHVAIDGEASCAVATDTLDHIIGDQRVALLKVDVEGYEALVLRGASKALSENRIGAVIVETNGSGVRYGYSDAQVSDTLQDYGFREVNYDPQWRNFRLNRKRTSNNRIYIRDLADAEARVASSERFSVLGQQF